jgi:hypothetical protein
MTLAAKLDAPMRAQPVRDDAAIGKERQHKLLAFMRGLAERGEPLPSNDVMRAVLGIEQKPDTKPEGALSRAIVALTRDGLIRMHYKANVYFRSVEIVGTDLRTPFPPPPPSRAKPKPPKAPRVRKARPAKSERDRPITMSARPFSLGYSDTFLYGHLADAVRECRRAGDVVYRDPRNKLVILINGHPGDVKARAAWHRRQCVNRNISRQPTELYP